MKKKILWVVISCLMVVGLVLASCAPEEEEEVVAPEAGTPKYGGTLTALLPANILAFDRAATSVSPGFAIELVNEAFVDPDWARGPAGTDEIDWAACPTDLTGAHDIGNLAESYELPEPGTFVLHIRQGVHWALDPNSEASQLVGGREFTADDAVFSLERYRTNPPGFVAIREPILSAGTTITKTGPWEVTIKYPPEKAPTAWNMFVSSASNAMMIAPEVIAKYGDQNDWRNVVGTGPFMITDFVDGGSMTMVRNPDYWMKDPVGPGKGNQLPYIDKLKYLIITDVATRLTAIRTAAADWIYNVSWEDAASLIESASQIQYLAPKGSASYVIYMRMDKKDLPFADKNVRQALMMAIDFQGIKNDYYLGEAEVLVWPQPPGIGSGYYPYVPLEKMPESVQELFSYNPEKAIQLLDEAGYSTGFETNILTQSTPEYVDLLSAVKEMWAEVGVTLTIQPQEYSVYTSLAAKRSYDQLLFRSGSNFTGWTDFYYMSGVGWNMGCIDDPKINQTKLDIAPYILTDPKKAIQMCEELWPYVVEQAYAIGLPEPYRYTMWWPRVKNYHGELGMLHNYTGFAKYIWLD